MVGFHTNAFVWAGVKNLDEIASFANKNGFDFLEVGPGIELDLDVFKKASGLVKFNAFCYCRNFIDDDSSIANRETEELFRRMEFASKVGAKRIVCSTGISKKLSIFESGGCNPLNSLNSAVDFLGIASEKAKQLGLEVCIENCPMYRNIATSPLMWRKIFEKIQADNLKLCYDASHFVWQMIDVYKPMNEFGKKISHVHMKDTALNRVKLDDVGILHNTGAERGLEENQWWRHTIIGDGEIDWKRFLKNLKESTGYLPDLSFEMEDYKYECVPEKVKQGLKLQLERLKKIM